MNTELTINALQDKILKLDDEIDDICVDLGFCDTEEQRLPLILEMAPKNKELENVEAELREIDPENSMLQQTDM